MLEMPSVDDIKALATVKEEQPKKEEVVPVGDISRESIIADQHKKNLAAIAENEDFKKVALSNDLRSVGAKLQAEENQTWNDELENDYKRYELSKKKEALDYKTKLEKNIVKEEVKAEVANKKYSVALARYGYLYKSQTKPVLDKNGDPVLDENGKPVTTTIPAKDFTPNKFINKTKELVAFYDNLSDEIKKVIWVSFKLVLVGLGIVGLYFGGKALVNWLESVGILNYI